MELGIDVGGIGVECFDLVFNVLLFLFEGLQFGVGLLVEMKGAGESQQSQEQQKLSLGSEYHFKLNLCFIKQIKIIVSYITSTLHDSYSPTICPIQYHHPIN